MAFGQQFNIFIQITWCSLPCYTCFVIPLTSGQMFPRYLLMEISYFHQLREEQKILMKQMYSNPHICLFDCVFHGTFPALLFGWQSFFVPALVNSDTRALSLLWHGAAVGTTTFQDTCPFQEYSGCQHVCLLNTWHTGNVVMYQIYSQRQQISHMSQHRQCGLWVKSS